MEVKLLDYQENALDILLYTKNTRLKSEMSLGDIHSKDYAWKLDQLAYMHDTIKSSWEFATYMFEVTGVSRAFTHQVVRTRTASFAQEAQRVVNLDDFDYILPKTIAGSLSELPYFKIMEDAAATYTRLVEDGIPRQDARNVIPTGVLTSIIIGANLRTLHNMAEVRLCARVQDEYQRVFKEMKLRVVEVHPWAEDFIQVFCVNHGTCCFPRYEECPIQKYTIQGEQLADAKNKLRREHQDMDFEANPIVKDGKTM